jgi:predicted nucleic acid-binding protein
LLPLYIKRATGHAWIASICEPSNQNLIILAEVTAAELAAALNQLVRGGTLRKKRCNDALALFWDQVNHSQFAMVPAVSSVVWRAADLRSVHALRGYDAIQLAGPLTVREDIRLAAQNSPASVVFGDPIFLTEDTRLRDAALAEGFVVDSPRAHP